MKLEKDFVKLLLINAILLKDNLKNSSGNSLMKLLVRCDFTNMLEQNYAKLKFCPFISQEDFNNFDEVIEDALKLMKLRFETKTDLNIINTELNKILKIQERIDTYKKIKEHTEDITRNLFKLCGKKEIINDSIDLLNSIEKIILGNVDKKFINIEHLKKIDELNSKTSIINEVIKKLKFFKLKVDSKQDVVDNITKYLENIEGIINEKKTNEHSFFTKLEKENNDLFAKELKNLVSINNESKLNKLKLVYTDLTEYLNFNNKDNLKTKYSDDGYSRYFFNEMYLAIVLEEKNNKNNSTTLIDLKSSLKLSMKLMELDMFGNLLERLTYSERFVEVFDLIKDYGNIFAKDDKDFITLTFKNDKSILDVIHEKYIKNQETINNPKSKEQQKVKEDINQNIIEYIMGYSNDNKLIDNYNLSNNKKNKEEVFLFLTQRRIDFISNKNYLEPNDTIDLKNLREILKNKADNKQIIENINTCLQKVVLNNKNKKTL